MYLFGNSFCVSFKWVVIISTKQEAADTQSAKVSAKGASEVLPLQKRGEVEKSCSHAEGGWGGTTSFEVVLIWELLAIVMGGGGRKKCPPFKVRLRWLGAVLQYPVEIYSFLFSINILIMRCACTFCWWNFTCFAFH